jgi:hypothetical protein
MIEGQNSGRNPGVLTFFFARGRLWARAQTHNLLLAFYVACIFSGSIENSMGSVSRPQLLSGTPETGARYASQFLLKLYGGTIVVSL